MTIYNREAYLLQTLEAMSCLDYEGMSVEFIVVNNNNTDQTQEVGSHTLDSCPSGICLNRGPRTTVHLTTP